MTKARILSMFSGYGGLDLAVEQVLGAETAYVADIDKGACKILAHRFPHAENLGDVSKVDYQTLGKIDIVTGGFPCQDVSTAGKRAGMKDGTRSGLWAEMHRAINELRPRLVVIENVRGLLSAKTADSEEVVRIGPRGGRKVEVTNRALGRVLADLADIGYDAQWCGLRAADVGAPHGRFRVFILASPADADRGRLIERDSGLGQFSVAYEDRGESVALLPTPAVNDMGAGKTVEAWDAWTAKMRAKHGNGNGHGASLAIEAQRLLPTPMTSYTASGVDDWRARRPAGNGQTRDIVGDLRLVTEELSDRWGDYALAIERWEGLTRPAPPPTEPTGKGGTHRLSPRFTEWMMGLPDGWITNTPGITRNEALKACGNGVVPQQAVAALEWLLAMERNH